VEVFLALQPWTKEEKKKRNLNFDIGGVAHNTREKKRVKKQFYHGQSSRE
jgi:hypothetical protein